MTNATKLRIAHIVSIFVAIIMPVTAVFQKLSVSKAEVSKAEVLSFGAVFILFILFVTLRKMLFKWIKKWLGFGTMPPIIMWIIFLALVVWLKSISEALTRYLPALQTICIAGVVGSGVGCIIDAVSNFLWNKKPGEDEMNE